MSHYLVRMSNVTSVFPESLGNNDLVVIKPLDLPTNIADLAVLHGPHSNMSRPMLWRAATGAFLCQHCGGNVNISRTVYERILKAISLEHNEIDLGYIRIFFAELVDEFPSAPQKPGWYAILKED